MNTQDFVVTGLTCGHCAAAVTEELTAIDGVENVHVALVPGGRTTLTVRGRRALTAAEVAIALRDAGDYRLERAEP